MIPGNDSPLFRPRCRIGGVAMLLAAWLGPVAGAVAAGEYNRVLDIGDPAPAWQGLPGVDGKDHSLADLRERAAVVLVFTCNSCPYAVDVEDRLVALADDLRARDVAVVAVNVNQVPEDSPEAMKRKAEAQGFRFPYLFDETQQIARDYGATTTPEWFVLDGQRRIAYMGSLDDSPDGSQVTRRYVRAAVDAVLQGDAPEVTETIPIGCRIWFERVRGGRRR